MEHGCDPTGDDVEQQYISSAGLGLLFLAGISNALLLLLYLFGPKAVQKSLEIEAIIDDTRHGV